MMAVAVTSSAQETYSRINVDCNSTTLVTTQMNYDWTTDNAGQEYAPSYQDYKGFNVGYTYGYGITSKAPLFVEASPSLSFLFNSANGIDFAAKKPVQVEDKEKGTVTNVLVGAKGKARDFMMSLNIPVNITYKFNAGKGWYIAPYAGLHLKFNIAARTSYTGKMLATAAVNFTQEEIDAAKEIISAEGYVQGTNTYADMVASKTTADVKEPAEYEEYSESINWFNDDQDNMESKARTYNRFQYGAQFGVNVGVNKVNIHLGWEWDSPIANNWKYVDGTSVKLNTRSFQIGVGYNL